DVRQKNPDTLQENPDTPQENPDTLQGNLDTLQETSSRVAAVCVSGSDQDGMTLMYTKVERLCYFPTMTGDYLVVELKPDDGAVLRSDAKFDEDLVVRFHYYDATDYAQLTMCCFGKSTCCPLVTKLEAKPDDKAWKSASGTCPAGTDRVEFSARNYGHNQGAIGISGIQLFKPKSGMHPEDADENVCASAGNRDRD
ncbi:unnamed protein product, partial [Soboliphyme baturini]|uniref:PLAT domain-containing protein n=1 Tax=Soboliphyme baturini TaxID=241478 RepID=A0A183IXB9_9BILA